jgi:tetratricopeptide (TPR) repeat protein
MGISDKAVEKMRRAYLFLLIFMFLLACPVTAVYSADMTDSATLKQQGAAVEAEGRWQDAIKIYRQALSKDPADAQLWMHVGELEESGGNDTAAAGDFQKAADLAPNNARAYYGLATAYSSLNKPRQAFAAIERAVQLDPENVQYLQARAELAAWNADYAAAADSYERLEKLKPGDDKNLLRRARVESWRGNNDKAVSLYKDYLNKHPENSDALMELAQAESWRGNYGNALSLLEKYRGKVGVNDAYLKQRARVLAWAERPRAARELNDPLLKRMPEDYDVNYTNTIALHYGNRPSEAIKSLEQIDRLRPGTKEAYDLRRFVLTPVRSFVEGGFSFYHDSDHINMYRSYLKGSYKLRPETFLTAQANDDYLTAKAGSGLERTDGGERAWHNSGQIGIINRFTPEFSADAYAGGAYTQSHWTVPYGIGADFHFWDALSFRIERTFGFYVDSPRTLSLGIRRGVDHLTAEWRPDPVYTVVMLAGLNDYSDSNYQWEVQLAPRRAVFRTDKINLDAGVYLERQGFRERINNGYYDPRLYQRYMGQIFVYWKIDDDDGIGTVLGYGIHKDETMGGFRATYAGSVEGTFGLYRDWMLKVSLGGMHNLRISGPYTAYTASLALTRRF